jgi:hypothetical protein
VEDVVEIFVAALQKAILYNPGNGRASRHSPSWHLIRDQNVDVFEVTHKWCEEGQ